MPGVHFLNVDQNVAISADVIDVDVAAITGATAAAATAINNKLNAPAQAGEAGSAASTVSGAVSAAVAALVASQAHDHLAGPHELTLPAEGRTIRELFWDAAVDAESADEWDGGFAVEEGDYIYATTDPDPRFLYRLLGFLGLSTGTTGLVEPEWPLVVGVKVEDGVFNAPADWAGDQTRLENDWCKPTAPNGFWYRATNAGQGHLEDEPTWPEDAGETVLDNEVTWMAYEADVPMEWETVAVSPSVHPDLRVLTLIPTGSVLYAPLDGDALPFPDVETAEWPITPAELDKILFSSDDVGTLQIQQGS